MNPTLKYQLLADSVLVLHASIVCFIVGGLILIILGNLCRWRWVNALWFRLAHLSAISVVAVEAWFGIACPLTTLEMWLRSKSGKSAYAGGFIEYWMQHFLYYHAPAWIFTLAYTAFGLAVAIAWWRFPPKLHT